MTDVTPQPEKPQPSNVIAALARVMAELPGIGRNERSQQGYNYRGIEAITREASSLLGKYGVVFVPKVLERKTIELTVNGKPWTEDHATIVYTVYGPGGVEDKIEVGPLIALGRDNSDKGMNKCLTQAFKYALLQVLCIGDSKDDADAGHAVEADAHPGQQVDPEAWFKTWGWADRTAHDERRHALVASARELDEKARQVLKKWVDEEGETYSGDGKAGWGTAWPFDLAEKIAHKSDLLKTPDATHPTPTPETPAPAPLSAADAESVGNALVEYLKGLDRGTLQNELGLRSIAVRSDITDDKMRQKLGATLLAEGWRPAQAPPTASLLATDPTICAWCGTGRTDTNELVDYREDGVLHARCRDEQVEDRKTAADPGREF